MADKQEQKGEKKGGNDLIHQAVEWWKRVNDTAENEKHTPEHFLAKLSKTIHHEALNVEEDLKANVKSLGESFEGVITPSMSKVLGNREAAGIIAKDVGKGVDLAANLLYHSVYLGVSLTADAVLNSTVLEAVTAIVLGAVALPTGIAADIVSDEVVRQVSDLASRALTGRPYVRMPAEVIGQMGNVIPVLSDFVNPVDVQAAANILKEIGTNIFSKDGVNLPHQFRSVREAWKLMHTKPAPVDQAAA